MGVFVCDMAHSDGPLIEAATKCFAEGNVNVRAKNVFCCHNGTEMLANELRGVTCQISILTNDQDNHFLPCF